jgi:hypothetical protein
LQTADEHGRYWIAAMNLFLGTWQGSKEERTGYWLRWWDASSNLLLWGVERIQVTLAIAQQERERADREQQEKERLLAILRSQGIDPQIQ